ncbi:MAG: Xanthan lyase, partial [Bacteroidetes bacterium]|nr:Xanthan lyase [Bacteroidota bacterium]
MTGIRRALLTGLAATITLAGCTPVKESQNEQIEELRSAVRSRTLPMPIGPGGGVDTVLVDDGAKSVTVMMNPAFAQAPFRSGSVKRVYSVVDSVLGDPFDGYSFSVRALQEPLEQLVPNYYRADSDGLDMRRLPAGGVERPDPIVRNASSPAGATQGLQGNNIGLWHSHGFYYNRTADRWMWQRARLFESVEDLGPMMFTLPYLVPMLENAGARVFLPRERDTQRHEVIVDNDSSAPGHGEKGPWETGAGPGFATGTPPYSGNHNPFTAGSYRTTASDAVPGASTTWTPDIPETGSYAVCVSYAAAPGNVSDARYVVYHAGGATEFLVNQRIGGGTWVYLGTFRFRAGTHPDSGSVVLTNESAQAGRTVTADAVRFGGGMGVIARNGLTSGRPKYVEGARYYLQFAGVNDTLVYNLNADQHDYRDDYQSRGEYINYLRGAPYGPNGNRLAPGLGIPVDVSLAFHTDAGITTNDTVVGTLSI